MKGKHFLSNTAAIQQECQGDSGIHMYIHLLRLSTDASKVYSIRDLVVV